MIEEVNLFLAIAQIAGVFVGFGALISVSRWSEIEAGQVGQIRAVVTTGLVVIVASLIPVGLGHYGISGHTLWFVCSLGFLLLSWGVIVISLRRQDDKALLRSRAQASPVMTGAFWLLLEVPMQVPLVLTVLGVYPDLEPAFYTTALVFNLFEAAFILAQLVYLQAGSPRK